MNHAVLLGDSIFDNGSYVSGQPSVIEQVRKNLPTDWQASLLAVDGNITSDVARQLTRMPKDATHLFISVGGNDALGAAGVMGEPVHSVAEALELLHDVQVRFRDSYRRMLKAVAGLEKPTTVCTIYDAVPGLGSQDRTALGTFNDVILREAFLLGMPVIDLRLVCNRAEDFSPISPIEPSFLGGAKIARVIAEIATTHDFSRRRTVIYA